MRRTLAGCDVATSGPGSSSEDSKERAADSASFDEGFRARLGPGTGGLAAAFTLFFGAIAC